MCYFMNCLTFLISLILAQSPLRESFEKEPIKRTFSGTDSLLFLDFTSEDELPFDQDYSLHKTQNGWTIVLSAASKSPATSPGLKKITSTVRLENSKSDKKISYSIDYEVTSSQLDENGKLQEVLVKSDKSGLLQNPPIDLEKEPMLEMEPGRFNHLRIVLSNQKPFNEVFNKQ